MDEIDERREDFLITVFREFADKGFKDFSTGFQRYYVRDVLNTLLEDNLEEYNKICIQRGYYDE
jgi:hypothetical protein